MTAGYRRAEAKAVVDDGPGFGGMNRLADTFVELGTP